MEILISEQQIQEQIDHLGKQINADYKNTDELIVVGVLNGSFVFCADLIRRLKLPVNLQFISVSSYEGTESSGNLHVHLDLRCDIKGKDVLIVEDIVDTGITLSNLFVHFERMEPKSVRLASFLSKPSRREREVKIDYLGFEIEDHFVIGYGLDFNNRYRELPHVGIYSND